MPTYNDISGNRYGKFTVLKKGNGRVTKGGAYKTTWICKCDCGNEKELDYQAIIRGSHQSCGCTRYETISKKQMDDLVGKKFNRLTVVRPLGKHERKTKGYNWLCQCDCGNYVHANGSKLKSGHAKSCGCMVAEHIGNVNRKYKRVSKRLYGVYKSMLSRCQDTNHREYHNYGGRGIKICSEWLGEVGYDSFSEWAFSNGYDETLKFGECTLDRIDTNGNYEPNNCRWITNKEQQSNRRDCIILEYNGEKHNVVQWSEILNISEHKIRYHLRKGRTLEQILKNYPD